MIYHATLKSAFPCIELMGGHTKNESGEILVRRLTYLSRKKHYGGVSFYQINTQYAMLYTQKHTLPHCFNYTSSHWCDSTYNLINFLVSPNFCKISPASVYLKEKEGTQAIHITVFQFRMVETKNAFSSSICLFTKLSHLAKKFV